ncbi:MAG: hypothetical protein JW863_20150 [Chitinispirillaceae bacterium]|nr:hypothetical protein [Chitinispirillaceae bacterium]
MKQIRFLLFVLTGVCLSLQSFSYAELTAYYPCDDGSGKVISDESGNGHDGEIMGTPDWVDDGKVDGALSFDGSYYADIPYQFPVPGSISLWIYVSTFFNYNPVFDNSNEGSDDPGNDWELWIQGEEIPQPWFECAYCVKMHLGGDGSSRQEGKVGVDLRQWGDGDYEKALDQWYHVVVTWDKSGETKLYVNTEPGEPKFSRGWKPAGQHIYLAGNQPDNTENCPDCGSGIHGKFNLDEIRIFDHVLSRKEVEELNDPEVVRIAMGRNSKKNMIVVSNPSKKPGTVTVSDLQGRTLLSREYANSHTSSISLPGGFSNQIFLVHTRGSGGQVDRIVNATTMKR